MIGRRGFLAFLAGATLDPERLLWEPGKRFISIASPTVFDHVTFCNTKLSPLTLEALQAAVQKIFDDYDRELINIFKNHERMVIVVPPKLERVARRVLRG